MTSDGSEGQTAANQQTDAVQDGAGAGGEQEVPWDKVAEAIRETIGVDLNVEMKKREQAAAATAAAEAGQKAQKTYDPRIAALEKRLQETQAGLFKAQEDVRISEIAKMPPEQQATAKALFEQEKSVRGLGEMRNALLEAAKVIAIEKAVLDLGKKGIEASADDFSDCNTVEGLEARVASKRAEHAERLLAESKAGTTKTEGTQPPAVSQKKAPTKPAQTAPAGAKPWEAQKKTGLDKGLVAALRAMREAE